MLLRWLQARHHRPNGPTNGIVRGRLRRCAWRSLASSCTSGWTCQRLLVQYNLYNPIYIKQFLIFLCLNACWVLSSLLFLQYLIHFDPISLPELNSFRHICLASPHDLFAHAVHLLTRRQTTCLFHLQILQRRSENLYVTSDPLTSPMKGKGIGISSSRALQD